VAPERGSHAVGIGPLIICLFLSFAAALCINYFIPFARATPRARGAPREGQLSTGASLNISCLRQPPLFRERRTKSRVALLVTASPAARHAIERLSSTPNIDLLANIHQVASSSQRRTTFSPPQRPRHRRGLNTLRTFSIPTQTIQFTPRALH